MPQRTSAMLSVKLGVSTGKQFQSIIWNDPNLNLWRGCRRYDSFSWRRSGLGSGGEIGHQLYKEFGAGKLDGVDFQSVPTDEAEGAGYGFWRLDAALATLE